MRSRPKQGLAPGRPSLAFRNLVLQPGSQNFNPISPLSQPVRTAKIYFTVGWDCAAGTTAPRNRVRKRSTQPAKIFHAGWPRQKHEQEPSKKENTLKSGEVRFGQLSAMGGSALSVDFLSVHYGAGFFQERRLLQIRSDNFDEIVRGFFRRFRLPRHVVADVVLH